MKTIEKFWLTIFTLVMIALVSYIFITPNDVLMKTDKDYLYYKEYYWWGLDSCIYKYHKPIYSDGKVIYVDEYRHIVGIIGKGGHWETRTRLAISYGNKTYKDEYHEYTCTHKYREGDKVKVVETFYPRYKIEYYK